MTYGKSASRQRGLEKYQLRARMRRAGDSRKASNGNLVKQRDLLSPRVAFDISADCAGERLLNDK